MPACDSATLGQLYYIIELSEFQYCNGSTFVTIDLTGPAGTNGTNGVDGINGTNGTNGISLNWLGSLATAPTSPNLNDAYYNTTLKKSYIWDGDSWEILAQDGNNGTSTSNNYAYDTLDSTFNLKTATTETVIPGLTTSITTTGGNLLISLNTKIAYLGNSALLGYHLFFSVNFYVYVDGVTSYTLSTQTTINTSSTAIVVNDIKNDAGQHIITGVNSDTHTITVKAYLVNSFDLKIESLNLTSAEIIVQEL